MLPRPRLASRSSQNMLASKVISYEKEIVQLRMETVKAKEMTKASLQELLITREELEEAKEMKNFLLEEQKRSREKEHLMSRLVKEQKRSARVEELKSRLAGLRAGGTCCSSTRHGAHRRQQRRAGCGLCGAFRAGRQEVGRLQRDEALRTGGWSERAGHQAV